MEDAPITDGTCLHTGIAFPAVERIAAQAQLYIRSSMASARWLGSVFNRHARTLRQIGTHGVCCIANQTNQTSGHGLRPLNRRTVRQRPQAPLHTCGWHAANQILQIAAAVPERLLQHLGIGGMVPMLQIVRAWAFDDDHDIHHLATAHGVVHGMHARPQPHGHFVTAPAHRNVCHGQQGTIGQVARNARTAAVAQHRSTQLAPDAIGQHQRIAFHDFVGGRPYGGHAFRAQNLEHFLPGVDIHPGAVFGCVVEQAVQVCTVDGHIGSAVAFHHGLPQWCTGQHLTSERTASHQLLRQCSHLLHGLVQAPCLQTAHHIRPQLHPCADLRKRCGTLEHTRIPARMRRSQRCSHACDASASNQYLFFHTR